MRLFLLLSAVFLFLNESCAINENYNFTYAMAMRCKEHICRHGYTYDTFYQINELEFQHTTVKRDDAHVTYFEMHIAIQAPSNGHILLSSVLAPGPSDPVYEIVVGGGGNKFTELRLNQKKNSKSSYKTPNILSSVEFTAFYIKIYEDGLVEFGKEGDSLPLVSYYDANTLPIKYFSFASWAGVEAKFLYDCPAPGDATTPDSQELRPKLSNSDDLKRSLLLSKLPSVPPSPKVPVNIDVRIVHSRYDALKSKVKTRMAVLVSWSDLSMAWNPSKYNGTTKLKFRQGQIWRPMFYVYNSVSLDMFDAKNPDLISVKYNGEVTFHFQAEVTTWCFNSLTGTNKWPQDEYICLIIIEPWQVHENITLQVMDMNDTRIAMFADIDEIIESEWKVTYKAMVLPPFYWNSIYGTEDNQTRQSDRLAIYLSLKRRAPSYNIVFYTPLLVLLTFVLISFWSKPLEMSRVWFYTACTIIICIGLSNIDFLIPTYIVPNILILYITVLGGVLLALLVQVMLMTSLAEKLCQSTFMQNILTTSMLRLVFGLPPIKSSQNGDYTRQDDFEDEAHLPEASVEEMESEEKSHGGRREVAEIIDKTMFLIYTITAAAMLADHY